MKLTQNDAHEVAYKFSNLADSEDLQEDYQLTPEQANYLYDSIPKNGGDWIIPDFALGAVRDEMEDHCVILDSIAADARSGGAMGESLRIAKQAKRLRALFDTQ